LKCGEDYLRKEDALCGHNGSLKYFLNKGKIAEKYPGRPPVMTGPSK
jgi:hypothetical protein